MGRESRIPREFVKKVAREKKHDNTWTDKEFAAQVLRRLLPTPQQEVKPVAPSPSTTTSDGETLTIPIGE